MRLDWKGTAMIKKSIAIVFVIAAFLMGAGITAMYTAVQAGAGQEQTLSLNRINMDIEDADGGYYNALADEKSPARISYRSFATKSLFIAEPNKIWLAIPPALKCLRNED